MKIVSKGGKAKQRKQKGKSSRGRQNPVQHYEPIPCGKWSNEENQLYIKFLRANPQKFESDLDRRSTKVFMMMAKAVQSRSAEQCRGHHRKMMRACGDIFTIIERLGGRRPANQGLVGSDIEVPTWKIEQTSSGVISIAYDINSINSSW